MVVKMTLGNKIQELRKKQLLSQEAFAEIMNVTRQSVSKWELDQSYPAIEKLIEIADFFNITLDELLRDEANPLGTNDISLQDIKINHYENATNINKSNNSKEYIVYFLWWAILAIIIMILFGIKEYFAGFIISQILVWSTVIIRIFHLIKGKTNNTK